MLKIVPLLGLLTISAFAEGGETDIVARAFNFLIFAGIIYYLIAEPLKSFFENRTLSIENEFKKNQEKLKESEEAKKEAEEFLAEAKRKAGIIVADANREIEIIGKQLDKSCENELKALEKQFQDLELLETSKMKRVVVAEVIQESFNSDIGLDSKSLTEVIVRKVAN
jgi:F-type H+-transporting ATPase subunit b